MLKVEVADLVGMDFDLSLLGFTEANWRASSSHPPPVSDRTMCRTAPAVPVSALGDVWVLGNHRIICGDCTAGGRSSRQGQTA